MTTVSRWIDLHEFVINGYDEKIFELHSEYKYVGNTTVDPLIILSLLDKNLEQWTNVNKQVFTLGEISFSGKGVYREKDI